MPDVDEQVRPDRRMVVPAAAAWATAALAVQVQPGTVRWWTLGLVTVAVASTIWRCRVAQVTAIVAAAVCVVCALRVGAVSSGPVADAGQARAVAAVEMMLTSDPRIVDTPHGEVVVADGTVTELTLRGSGVSVRVPVVVWADDLSWAQLDLGTHVEAVGRFGPAEDSSVGASFDAHRLVADRHDRAWWWSAADALRSTVTEGVAPRGPDVSALVPALVHGDDHALSDDLSDDFRTSGLTHLLAVSGTNLTLVIGFLLAIARSVGVHGRTQIVLAVLGTVGFVILARPEPSVVRAACMGLIAVVGLGTGGRRRGIRCLSWAVVILLLIDPWLARSAGFVLSASATAGILVLGPPWRDALARWMPVPLAELLAVPMAAQVACTPAVAAIAGQVSMVAVVANLLVGPAVGPATVLGLLGGLVGLASTPASHLVGLGAASCAGWIVIVGRRSAQLPGAALEWGSGPIAVGVLVLVCVLVVLLAAPVLRRPWAFAVAALVLVIALWRPVSLGWPPPGWVMVACDVGQGDATVLNAGDGHAIVVDAGPDPDAVDRCLDRLRVDTVPLVLLTHDHADHVDGLPGVLRGREVAQVAVGPSGGPSAPAGTDRRTVQTGERQRAGHLSWTVLAPTGAMADVASTATGAGAVEGSTANNASVVLLVEVRGVSILMAGDIEPEAQEALLRSYPTLRADILKVPHHGSTYQDPGLFEHVDARFGTISVGADNTYGHPGTATIALMQRTGIQPLRTDLSGDLAIVEHDGTIEAVTSDH